MDVPLGASLLGPPPSFICLGAVCFHFTTKAAFCFCSIISTFALSLPNKSYSCLFLEHPESSFSWQEPVSLLQRGGLSLGKDPAKWHCLLVSQPGGKKRHQEGDFCKSSLKAFHYFFFVPISLNPLLSLKHSLSFPFSFLSPSSCLQTSLVFRSFPFPVVKSLLSPLKMSTCT